MKTSATNKKIREIIGMVRKGSLIPRPEFQRRLVWSREDKNHFIDSVLRNFPFPEIYICDGEVDLDTGEGNQLLVDGLQRVSTLVQYFEGDINLKLTTVPPYETLPKEDKEKFLQYDIAVRDLGAISKDQVIETFKRLNATSYSLTDIEINNAIFAGKLKQYAEGFASAPIFTENNVFSANDFKRMNDLRFSLGIIITMLNGYSHRDDMFEDMLGRYNDDFPLEKEIDSRAHKVIEFIEECNFSKKSRIWKKADLLTFFCELDIALNQESKNLDPSIVIDSVENFFSISQDAVLTEKNIYSIYYKAAVQASNDRVNRVRRGIIIQGILEGLEPEIIFRNLVSEGYA